jgi:hypothetical protein
MGQKKIVFLVPDFVRTPIKIQSDMQVPIRLTLVTKVHALLQNQQMVSFTGTNPEANAVLSLVKGVNRVRNRGSLWEPK